MQEYCFDLYAYLGNKECLVVLDGSELVRLWKEGIITYNPEIQRGSRSIINKNNEIVEEAVYSKANVKKIYESMIAGTYFEDMITLNVIENDQCIFDDSYDIENGKIFVSGEINISDGQHRIRALEMLSNSNEKGITNINLNSFVFPIKLTNYDTKTARMQFYQFSKGLKISSSRSEYFNTTNHSNEIVRNLMKDSELAGRIEIVKNTITKKEKKNVVTFATMVNAVKMVYGEMTAIQSQELCLYLNEFFNELFNIVSELLDFDARQQSKGISLKAENFAFYGYVSISKLLREQENWQQKLRLVNELDLNKESDIWFGRVTKAGRNGNIISNSKDSRSYFIQKIREEFQTILENQQFIYN